MSKRIGLRVLLAGWAISQALSAVAQDTKPASASEQSAAGSAENQPVLSIRSLAFSPDGKTLVAGTGEPNQPGAAILWDLAARTPRWIHRDPMAIPAVAFSPDGKMIAIGIHDHTAKLLDSANGSERKTLRGHEKEVRAVAFSPDGRTLATGSWDRTVKLWDTASGDLRTTLSGHTERVMGLAFSHDGALLASVADKQAFLWDVKTGAQQMALPGHGTFVIRCIEFSPDDQWIVTGGWDGKARVWNVKTAELRLMLQGRGGVDSAVLSPRGTTLALCSRNKAVQLYDWPFKELDTPTREQIAGLLPKLDAEEFAVREQAGQDLAALGLVVEPALRQALRESESAEVRIRARRLRAKMLEEPTTLLEGSSEQFAVAAFSPDGSLLAGGGKEGIVTVWDVDKKREIARLTQSLPK